MNIDLLKSILLSILLLFFQGVVFNNIHIFGCVTPLMLVYILMVLPNTAPRWVGIAAGFLLGVVSDMFSNTPGVAACSLTFIGFIQPVVLNWFLSNENNKDVVYPSMKSLGISKFVSYCFILLLAYCILIATLEQFSFFNILQWLLNIVGSFVITALLIFTIENFRKG